MSLKHVHTVFIVAATALAAVCAAEAFTLFQAERTAGLAAASVTAIGAVVLLVTYEARFLRRCQRARTR